MLSNVLVMRGAQFSVQADSLHELFSGALCGVNEALKSEGIKRIEDDFAEWIHVSAPDPAALLSGLLSEALSLSRERGVLFHRVEFEILSEQEIGARVYGAYAGFFDRDIYGIICKKAEARNDFSSKRYAIDVVLEM